jgi:hypothetical protein
VALVRIARLAHAALQLHAAALLHHVRRLVRRRVQAGRAGERDVRAGGVGLGAHRLRRGLRRAAHVGRDAAHVVAAERPLDLLAVRQRPPAAGDALRGRSLDLLDPCGSADHRLPRSLVELHEAAPTRTLRKPTGLHEPLSILPHHRRSTAFSQRTPRRWVVR